MAEVKWKIVCPHKWVYGGVKYKNGDNPLAGTGARKRTYYDFFYCEKCREKQFDQLEEADTTYDDIRFGATPK
jgi:hypothetical protein